MASFVSTAVCPMLTLPTAAATRVRITAFQQTSFSTSGSPVFCGLRSSAPKVEFLKAANISSNRSRYFKSAVSCSAAQSETLQTVQSTIAKQLSIDVSTVTPDTKFADLGADSLDTVEIMMALEEQFEVSIGEGGAENIATVQDAADLIEKVKAASS